MFRISLNRVHDKIKIQQGNESLILRVDADPMKIAADMRKAAEKLQNSETMPEDERNQAIKELAEAVFGAEQAYSLFDLYNHDSTCVMAVMSKYIERLTKLVTQAQKRQK